jgi:phosphoribosylformimino-5-aminoimidazole carboxamide ribotide isomerase
MLILPAIDIRRGKCVRLLQGRADQETVYGDNPLETALNWERLGAPMLHVVDLDGAFEGTPQNASLIESILLNVRVPVQVGGGIRSPGTVERYVGAGAARVVLGTIATHNISLVRELAERFPGKISVGIDAKNGLVAVNGWTKGTQIRAADLAREYVDSGIAGVIYTDVARDGMRTGPNVEAVRALAAAVPLAVIASGGVGGIEHIRALAAVGPPALEGVIVGKALYTGDLTLADALAASGASAPASASGSPEGC